MLSGFWSLEGGRGDSGRGCVAEEQRLRLEFWDLHVQGPFEGRARGSVGREIGGRESITGGRVSPKAVEGPGR